MKQNLYMRESLAAKFKISQARLAEMEKLKLIRPAGLTEDKAPVYSDETILQIAHIRKLEELAMDSRRSPASLKKWGCPRPKRAVPIPPSRTSTSPSHARREGRREPPDDQALGGCRHHRTRDAERGGFRLYPQVAITLCHLIKDLQVFGYSLEEIKNLSDYFRDFLAVSAHPETLSKRKPRAGLRSCSGKSTTCSRRWI